MRHLYTILYYLATPFLLLRLAWRGLSDPRYAKRWAERFAHIPTIKHPKTIWLHAVSLGESIAATPLIEGLIQQLPDYRLVVTTTTPTGSAHISKTFADRVYHVYAPYDLPHVIKRFLKRTHPAQAIIMETELWPNILQQLKAAQVPTLIANARLSARSFGHYSKLSYFFRPLLRHIIINAQSTADAKRFKALGGDSENTVVTGNIKFDHLVSDELITQAKALKTHWKGRPTLIAASTHEGEEAMILAAFKHIRQQHPNTLLLLVPRHPERFNKVADLCRQSSYRITRRSAQQLPDTSTDIYLCDTTGELSMLYATSDVAFVGGSLVAVGGHNLIEPASLSLPIVSGTQLHNFVAIRDLLLEANALIIVENTQQLATTISELLADPERCHQYGARALSISEANRGAIKRHLAIIIKQLDQYQL